MNKKLEKKLYKSYPKLFKERKLSLSESAMARGIECSDSWYALIDELCNYINFQIISKKCKQITITQIKSKFGRLRIHTSPNISKEVYGAIGLAMFLSYRICENCSSMKKVKTKSGKLGYISSLCENCRKSLE